MSARDDVLARVRSALRGATAPGAPLRDYRAHGDLAPGDARLLELLEDRLIDYKAGVWRTDAAGVAGTVAAALAKGLAGRPTGAGGRHRVVVPAGLPEQWLTEVDADIVQDDRLTALDLDRLHGVVTAARVAVAETGTFVLDAAADQGRRALTLVPDLHVCVVLAEQVVETVPEAVARLDPTRPLTWVSGPSATSDIELVRVEGVHGPRTLEVVLVE